MSDIHIKCRLEYDLKGILLFAFVACFKYDIVFLMQTIKHKYTYDKYMQM